MRRVSENRFVCSGRVRFSELDPQGVVFYSRYLEYIDDAIITYWRERGVTSPPGASEVEFQVKSVRIDYQRPLRQDEQYDIGLVVSRVGTSSVTFAITVYGNGGTDVCSVAEVVHVNVALAAGTSVPMTAALREILQRDMVP